MLEKSKSLQKIKKELEPYLKDKEILDVILFGSYIKGKENPSDIDLALITSKELGNIKGYHLSLIRPEEFFRNIPSLVNTLLKEGYSLKSNQFFSEKYGFKNKVMFVYELSNLSNSKKVKIVNFLKGTKKNKGLVEKKSGEWLSKGVFLCPTENDFLFEQFFLKNRIKFKKYNLLIH